MWSDAARASSMQSRGVASGGGGSLGGGGGGGPAATPAGGVGARSGLSTGMANAGGRGRGGGGKGGGNHTSVTITGDKGFAQVAAHQGKVNGLNRSMGPQWSPPWNGAAAVAKSAYALGSPGGDNYNYSYNER